MQARINESLCQIFKDWQEDDKQLQKRTKDVRDWMAEVNQLGIPHFGETAQRLRIMRKSLVEHFDRENEMIDRLSANYPAASPEIAAVKRQSNRDHETLIYRIDDLIKRLKADDPLFPSWTAAMQEVDLFFETLDEHEYQESDRMRMLMPRECEWVAAESQ